MELGIFWVFIQPSQIHHFAVQSFPWQYIDLRVYTVRYYSTGRCDSHYILSRATKTSRDRVPLYVFLCCRAVGQSITIATHIYNTPYLPRRVLEAFGSGVILIHSF
jgi:hypothetical protein